MWSRNDVHVDASHRRRESARLRHVAVARRCAETDPPMGGTVGVAGPRSRAYRCEEPDCRPSRPESLLSPAVRTPFDRAGQPTPGDSEPPGAAAPPGPSAPDPREPQPETVPARQRARPSTQSVSTGSARRVEVHRLTSDVLFRVAPPTHRRAERAWPQCTVRSPPR